ncbi:MAG: hypothetical protein ABI947_08080 [Chloroflexota bacterium]
MSNNVKDNLDDKGVTLGQIEEVALIVEGMNATISQVITSGDETDEGIVFNGTREQYEAIGSSILSSLYEMEPHIVSARVELSEMNK